MVQGRSQMLDALAYRAMGDVHLLCGTREVQVSGSRFEETKRLERRKCAGHPAMIAALTAGVSKGRWQSSRRHRIIRISLVLIALNEAKQSHDNCHVLARA